MAACGKITCALLFVAVATLLFVTTADATFFRRGQRGSNERRSSGERSQRGSYDRRNSTERSNSRGLVSLLMQLGQRLKDAERSGCNSDSLNISVCQNDTDTGCFIAEPQDDNSTVIEVPVMFKPTFASVPVAIASLAGTIPGQEAIVLSRNITSAGFTIVLISRVPPPPSRLYFFWFACNKAMG